MESGRVYWLLLALHALAILFFTKGFLLTRTELPHFSHCSDVRLSPCFADPGSAQCWTEPAVDRIVVVVLDALRFDFVAPSSLFQGEKKPWMDRLKVLQELATRNPKSVRIFKAIADPPTTSLQRLKGLTTGGLPTFIDVGNSFGAPAIIEDNLLHQLAQNGKRVVMMGDDTWMQLFPHHFTQSYPFPSFNVKDLDTVDNGCIEHLVPSLYKDDWDVLIAHFLGVDHAGHIFGVDSVQMLEKLEHYNLVLENVIDVLKNESGPGGLHENTLLLVMGDHGQTLNGDHGGGTPEEVETSIFAMNFKKPVISAPSGYNASATDQDLDKRISINSFQQLDFAGTISALLGIPFPFGSIGHVNRDLYALGAGTRDFKGEVETCENDLKFQESMKNYVNVLCINSWQVKRYIDVYSASSVIGFSREDLLHIEDLYARAVENWSRATKDLFIHNNESCDTVLPALERQIGAYTNFLASVAELARSKWTEFNLRKMAVGFGIMLLSIVLHIIAITRVKKKNGIFFSSSSGFGISSGTFLACFIVAIRASSFLSNSYILEEGKAASFLLATSGISKLRDSVARKKNMIVEVVVFLLVITVCRLTLEFGVTKQTPGFDFSSIFSSWVLKSRYGLPVLSFIPELMPILSLIVLSILLCKAISKGSSERAYNYAIVGTVLSYVLIASHWVSESNIFGLAWVLKTVGKNSVPQIVYGIGLAQLLLLTFHQLISKRKEFDSETVLGSKTVAILSSCSSTIIVLSGKQGALISIAAIIGGYCIMRLGHLEKNVNSEGTGNLTVDPLTVIQWSLLAVCLFFCTGHWCTFDGLRYGAAFIGFDEFVLVRQAILLTIDTFGASLVLPIFGLPLLVAYQNHNGRTEKKTHGLIKQLSLVYMLYGLVTAITVTATMMCVAVHRRHLMVWGLFAPKFVFDVFALLLTDLLTCVASLYYF